MADIKIYDNRYINLSSVDWDFADAVVDPLASIHPYPARFINEIPKHLIERVGCPKGTIILDPFCGSGTTLVEAQRHGVDSVGIDLNPIACLISKVKTQPLPDGFFSVVERTAVQAMKLYKGAVSIPKIPNIDHWFKQEIQKALSALLYIIHDQEDQIIKDALRIALSSIIVRVSNQESDTRYAAIDKSISAYDVFRNFIIAGKKIAQVKAGENLHNNANILLQDVLTVDTNQIGKKVGLVVTSPPYPNAYEYWLYHKYRMWWLGYDPIEVRTFEIGARPHYQKKNGQTEKDFYRQMNCVFDTLAECLVVDGHICFVVGRSIISGRVIDNAELIQDIGEKHNLVLVANITREIAPAKKSFNLKYGKIKEENILVFRKDKSWI